MRKYILILLTIILFDSCRPNTNPGEKLYEIEWNESSGTQTEYFNNYELDQQGCIHYKPIWGASKKIRCGSYTITQLQ